MRNYVRGFIPWILSGVISVTDWRWGAAAGLLSALLLLRQDRRRGFALDSEILEISSLVYFAVIGAIAMAVPHSALRNHTDVASFCWLALTAWGTLVIGRPFTLGIARRQTPREFWDRPEFFRINAVITAAWGAGFTFIGAAIALDDAIHAPGWVSIAAHVVGLVAPAAFTVRYPARVQARIQARLRSAEA
jgi:hypothetical protein